MFRGGPAGTLTIEGDFSQASGGTLSIEIGGLIPGTAFDRLVVSGRATLDGTLALKLIDGFFPGKGDKFEVMTFRSLSGAFNSVTGTDIGGGLALGPDYNRKDLTVIATKK